MVTPLSDHSFKHPLQKLCDGNYDDMYVFVHVEIEELQESTIDVNGKCIGAMTVVSTLMNSAYGLTNKGIAIVFFIFHIFLFKNEVNSPVRSNLSGLLGFAFTGYPVVGYHNKFQASGTCLDSHEDAHVTACAWDPSVKGEFFHQTTFSIGLSMAKSFIQDVQKLNDLVPKAMCGIELYNGILMRYVKASSAYLGKQEDAVDFDITYYRSKDPTYPRLYEDILEEVEQLALFKYGALPHWGKNRNLAFEGVIKRYKNARNFLKIKNAYDPLGLFSSEWTNQILGLEKGVMVDKPGCALEGLCICSKDSHCAPSKGYYCRSGKIYKDARVCSRSTSFVNMSAGGGDVTTLFSSPVCRFEGIN